ncbi:ABC transporter permease subunit/CPBP intramembrane protease [Archangium sp.]|jgi:sodium transport system permease protein|uniref:ABC transporter permease subunit/CPBP intramembrane protease n=1 Tax=Archangium sp. TaxID=1872627 RepID=UPI002ED8BF1C
MRWSIVLTLFRKDLLEALRDRRTLLLLVGLPLLLYPLLLVATALMSGALARDLQEKPLKLAVWGPAPASLLEKLEGAERVEWVERRESIPEAPAQEARKLLDERKATAVLALTPVPGADGNLSLELYFDSGRPPSGVARRRLNTVLDEVRQQAVRVRFENAGLSPRLAEPLQVKESDFRSVGLFLGAMLPYLLLLALVMAGFYPAIDVTAGEKERGTLQTLLCAPVRPLEVVLGKYGVVSVFTLGGALLNLGGMGLAIVGLVGASGTVGKVQVSLGVLVAAFGALVPLAMLVSAVLVAVGVMARSFKEGQNYLTPVLLGVLVLAHGAMMPGVELTPKLALVPILNVALLLRELLTAKVETGLFALVFTSTLAWAVAGVLFAARVFESEQVLLSGEKPWRDLFGRKVRRGDHFSPGSALLYFSVILVVSLFVSVLLWKRLPLWGVMAVTQVGVFLALAVLWVQRSGADPREVFSLRLPTRRGALAMVLLAPGVLGVQVLLQRALGTGWMPGTEEFLRTLEVLMKQSASWPLPLALAVLALAPAVCEEAAFRGVMLSGLSRTGSRAVAVVGSALTFGILHIHPVHALIAAAVGLVLGHATLRTRSLLAGVFLHFVNNGTAVLAARAGTEPAWMGSWQVGLALCMPGVVALWLLRDADPVPTHQEEPREAVPEVPVSLPKAS